MAENSSNTASAAESTPKKRGHTGRIVLAVFLLVLIGLACFIRFTETGQSIPPKVLVFMDSLFAGGSPEKEKAAAQTIEALNLMVIREGEEQKVTSIQRKEKKIDIKVFEELPDLYRIGTVNLTDTDVTDEQMKSIGKLRQLTSLLLGGTAISDEGLVQLRNLGELESLHLQNTQITDAGLAHLAAMPSLKILDISGTKITDAGMKELAKCQQLNWLLMSQTQISDAGIQAFENHPRLGRLTIFDTKVTPAGIEKLIKSKDESTAKLSVDSGKTPKGTAPGPAANAQQPEDQKPADQNLPEKK